MTDVRYTVIVRQEENFGDHGEFVMTSRDAIEGETVEDLILRAFPRLNNQWYQHNPSSQIIIQVTAESAAELNEAARLGVVAPRFDAQAEHAAGRRVEQSDLEG